MAGTRTTRSRFSLALAVLTSLTLMATGSLTSPLRGRIRDVALSLHGSGGRVTGPVGNVVGSITGYRDLKAENARLRKQLDEARAASLRYRDALRERRELLALIGLKDPADVPKVAARVIAQSLGNFEETMVIDRGSDAGLSVGMPVVTAAGLVGHLSSLTPDHATVTLVTDTSSGIGVRLSESGDVGVAHGQRLGRPLTVDLVDLDSKVRKGEVLVTSGLQGSRYPAGIPVGTVRSVRRGTIQQDVTIDPIVDIRRVSFVEVLRWKGR